MYVSLIIYLVSTLDTLHASSSSSVPVESTIVQGRLSTRSTAFETSPTTWSDIKEPGTCEIVDKNEDITAFYEGVILERKARVSE